MLFSLPRRPYLPLMAYYLVLRAFGVGVLALMASYRDLPMLDRMTAWDGWWYLHLAQFGYSTGLDGLLDAAGHPYPDAAMAFFPLYPDLIALVAKVPGVSLPGAALTISAVAGMAAAAGLGRLAKSVSLDPRTGWILVTLWAAAPMAIVQSMAYTESLFTALAVWALVGVVEKRWYLAGLCALFAGLSRSTASVLIAVIFIAALIDLVRSRTSWSAMFAMAVSPMGLLAYWAFVADRTGSVTGWSDIEWRGWNTGFDFGKETADELTRALLLPEYPVWMLLVWITLFGAITLAALGVRRIPWPLAAYSIGVVLLVLGTAGLPAAKPRFLLPAATLLIPLALGLVKLRPRTAYLTLAVYVLVGAWISGYGLTVWRYAI